MQVLVLVDIQNDFINGSLGVGKRKFNVAFNNIKSIFKDYDYYVVTKDWHPKDHCSFNTNGGKWPPHCIKNRKGSRVYDELDEMLKDTKNVTILKGQEQDTEQYGVDCYDDEFDDSDITMDFVGLCYDYCVYNCAKITKAYHKNIKVRIIKNCTVAIDDNAKLDLSSLEVI